MLRSGMLSVEHLSVRFGSLRALDDVSGEAVAGSIVTLAGPNGAGKSTLLRAIAGLLPAGSSTGTIVVSDGAGVTFCPDTTIGFLDLSAIENLELLMLALGWDESERAGRLDSLLSVLEIGGAAERPLGDLSLGLRRRVDLALTICRASPLVLFDEPYNGLDADWITTFGSLVELLAASGRVVLVATHALELVLPLTDTLWELEAGRMGSVSSGPRGTLEAGSAESSGARRSVRESLGWLVEIP